MRGAGGGRVRKRGQGAYDKAIFFLTCATSHLTFFRDAFWRFRPGDQAQD
jgi:hypothetical protein